MSHFYIEKHLLTFFFRFENAIFFCLSEQQTTTTPVILSFYYVLFICLSICVHQLRECQKIIYAAFNKGILSLSLTSLLLMRIRRVYEFPQGARLLNCVAFGEIHEVVLDVVLD